MIAPVLSVSDEDVRRDVTDALRAGGLDWDVLPPRDVPAEAALVLGDTPRNTPELRKLLRHDVRTPLAVMLGQADLLELEPLTARQQRCVETLRKHCERLEQMLSRIARDVVP